MSVGRTEQVVQVEGEASRVDTETSSVGQLLSPNQMENLPSNGRNFTDLLSLAPGVATVPASGGGGGQSATVYGTQTNYSVSGSRPVGLSYMLDDTDIRDALDHGAGVSVMGTSLGMEAIQEFSVLTNTYSAEFGGTGAAVNAVTNRVPTPIMARRTNTSATASSTPATTSTPLVRNRVLRGINSAARSGGPSRRIRPSSL